MSSDKRVALVTGASKGVGLGVVRGLCKKFDGDVFLTARNETAGQEAVKALTSEGLHPKFHQLDITASDSVERLKSFLQDNYGGLDVLVNNAGIAYPMDAPYADQAEVTMKTNFWGTLNACRMFPLLRPHARVVNVSSYASNYVAGVSSKELQSQFAAPDLSMDMVENLMNEFVQSAKDGTYVEKGWPASEAHGAYGISKVGVTLMSFVQQKAFSSDPREDIVVNVCCPGHVATEMSNFQGKTIDEGADTALYLALLPANTEPYIGKLVSDRKAADWP